MNRINIGMLGLGVVGSAVARTLAEKGEAIAQRAGCPITLKRVLVRDQAKRRPWSTTPGVLVTDAAKILDDPEIGILVELMGGEHPATEFIESGLKQGKRVVTANKEVMAKRGPELLELAQNRGTDLLFEASVGGGIPIIGPLRRDLSANDISAIYAIINGTTNYILSSMDREGKDFPSALQEAQDLGYAEADPSSDTEGLDAAYKLAIMATLAFRSRIHLKDVYHEGISKLAARDFRYARELGYAIKLLAIAKKEGQAIQLRVHPTFIPEDRVIAKVDGVYNAIQLEGDLIGQVLFHGLGAGPNPTTSAVIGDIIEAASGIRLGTKGRGQLNLGAGYTTKAMAQVETRYYVRLTVADQPGVLAQIAKVLGDRLISIASVIQKEAHASSKSAELVIMTHPALEEAMQKALAMLALLPIVKEVGNFVRVED